MMNFLRVGIPFSAKKNFEEDFSLKTNKVNIFLETKFEKIH